LGGAHQLAEAVADEDGAGHLVADQVARVRQHGGDASPHVVAAHERRVPDPDAGEIRDGIVPSHGQDAHGEAHIPRPGPLLLFRSGFWIGHDTSEGNGAQSQKRAGPGLKKGSPGRAVRRMGKRVLVHVQLSERKGGPL
jgi:hypothetical protein